MLIHEPLKPHINDARHPDERSRYGADEVALLATGRCSVCGTGAVGLALLCGPACEAQARAHFRGSVRSYAPVADLAREHGVPAKTIRERACKLAADGRLRVFCGRDGRISEVGIPLDRAPAAHARSGASSPPKVRRVVIAA